jgi:hypothetical protein
MHGLIFRVSLLLLQAIYYDFDVFFYPKLHPGVFYCTTTGSLKLSVINSKKKEVFQVSTNYPNSASSNP